jgi:hypothetical protein
MYKILKIKNMADVLPQFPDHRIVLFNNNPKISCKEFTAVTDAKLWFHFDPKQTDQITAQQLIEVGALSPRGAENAVKRLKLDLQNESKGIRVKYPFSAPFMEGHVILYVHPPHYDEVTVLMPYHYQYRMGGELINGQKGFVWQSIPIDRIGYLSWDLDDFPFYCAQRLGLYEWDSPDKLRKMLETFAHDYESKRYADYV